MPGFLDAGLLEQLRDPTTPGEVLRQAQRFIRDITREPPPGAMPLPVSQREYQRDLTEAIHSNPNLPADLLREALLDGILAAWLNPATPLHLLECPMPDEERLRAPWKVLCAMVGRPDLGNRRPGKIDYAALYGREGFRQLRQAFPGDVDALTG